MLYNLTMENWKDIPKYDKYQVSDGGNIRNKASKQILSPRNNYRGKGYLKVALFASGIRKDFYIHRLVYSVFKKEIGYNLEINHIDGNPKNNNLHNLEESTHTENIRHAFKLGLVNTLKGEKHLKHKLSEKQVNRIREEFETGLFTQKQLSQKYYVHPSNIGYIIRRKIWTHI
jgi:hypothetical protein